MSLPAVWERTLCGIPLLELEIAGSGYIGLDYSDRVTLGLLTSIYLDHDGGAPVLNLMEVFIETRCTKLPPHWGPKTHPSKERGPRSAADKDEI